MSKSLQPARGACEQSLDRAAFRLAGLKRIEQDGWPSRPGNSPVSRNIQVRVDVGGAGFGEDSRTGAQLGVLEIPKDVGTAGLRSDPQMLQRLIQNFLLSRLGFGNQEQRLRTTGKRLHVVQLALQLESCPGMLSNFLLELDRSQVCDLSLALGRFGVVRHLKDFQPLIGLLVEDKLSGGVVLLEMMQC